MQPFLHYGSAWFIVAACFLVGASTGCDHSSAEPTLGAGDKGLQGSQAEIIGNMPMNHDSHCAGICMVAEALLHEVPSNDSANDTVEQIGKGIFNRHVSGAALTYRPEVLINGRREAIWSKAAQEQISAHVTELYKERYLLLAETEAGQKTLRKAYRFVPSENDLDRILQQQKDQIELFAGMGTREFATGEQRQTNHVFLVARGLEGRKVVYDPNEPGRAIACDTSESNTGVRLSWRCLYQDTMEMTTQSYLLIEKSVAFGTALHID